MRAVSVLEVAEESEWALLSEQFDLEEMLGEELGACRRVASPAFERLVLPKLSGQILVRYARTAAPRERATPSVFQDCVKGLSRRAVRVLETAARHAWDEVVVGVHCWDPRDDADAVRALHGAGLLTLEPGEPPLLGRYRVSRELGLPPEVPFDFSEATMPLTDDLSIAQFGPVQILEDAAALAAAIDRAPPRRTHKDVLARADTRRLAKQMGVPELEDKPLETHPRWGLALRALEALGAVRMDPMERRLYLDLGLDETLSGETHEAVNRLVTKLLDRDLHPLLPAIREALRQANEDALDTVILGELIREQHRDVLFPCWRRGGAPYYPLMEGEPPRPYDDDGWEDVEEHCLRRALRRLARIGLIRDAEGVVAATADGRAWASSAAGPRPPVWVSSDLELIIAPGSVTPGERFQLERLSRCLSRDVTDRLRLEEAGLRRWLSTHDLTEVLQMLRRRAPGLPANVIDTLQAWDRSARRVVLTRGVLLPSDPCNLTSS